MMLFIQQNLAFLGVLCGVLAITLSIFALIKNREMQKKQKLLLMGKNGLDLEEIIIQTQNQITELRQEHTAVTAELMKLKQISDLSFQKIGLIRYSPFADGGGNYSFSLALINAHNSGVVITNMYGRQQSRVYVKQLVGGKCTTVLTEEEQQAMQSANYLSY